MDQKELQNLIRFISKSGVAEVSYRTDEYELKVKNISSNNAQQLVQASVAAPQIISQPLPQQQAPVAKETQSAGDEGKYVTIKSPMIGTFYRKPAPEKPLFVNVGDDVTKGKVVCVIEAMKLFNEIEADISGKVIKVLVEDSMPVEFDQPLFLIDPS